MKRLFPLMVSFGVILSGCTAQMLETRGDQLALFRSPTEKPGRGGIIRYNDRGAQSWREARRKDALRQISEFCSGPYTIAKEGRRSDISLRSGIGTNLTDPNRYIEFDCAKPAEPTLFK